MPSEKKCNSQHNWILKTNLSVSVVIEQKQQSKNALYYLLVNDMFCDFFLTTSDRKKVNQLIFPEEWIDLQIKPSFYKNLIISFLVSKYLTT